MLDELQLIQSIQENRTKVQKQNRSIDCDFGSVFAQPSQIATLYFTNVDEHKTVIECLAPSVNRFSSSWLLLCLDGIETLFS